MRHLDLFSGYGGFTLGLQGFVETVGFAEIDKYASAVLAYNFKNIENYGDVTKIDFKQFDGKVDIITGGTPCQDLSLAGKRKGLAGERSGLFFEFIRALTESHPNYFIWENVKGALSSNGGWDFARVQIEMEQAGYNVQWQVLNAKYFGVPQSRDRIFAIGSRKSCPRKILRISENSGQTIRGINKARQGYRVFDPSGISRTLTSNGGGLGAKTGLYAIDLSVGHPKITAEVRAIQARYAKGYSNRQGEVSGVLTPSRIHKRQNGRRFKPNESFALTTQDRHGVFDGYRIRRLTPLEAERLMGLPDNWTAKGIVNGEVVNISDTQRYKMCGNGVVVPVVTALAELFF